MRLWHAKDADAFSAGFRASVGCSVEELVERFVAPGALTGCMVIGRIPLGIATRTSKIELVASVADAGARRLALEGLGAAAPTRVLEKDSLSRASSVSTATNGSSIVVHIAVADELIALIEQLLSANVEWESEQAVLLSRLKTGWVLRRDNLLEPALERLRHDRALEAHCTTKSIVGALKCLEDAVAALRESRDLARYLGRFCVENCFAASFASRGIVVPEEEWLELVERERMRSDAHAGAQLRRLGLPLLFPSNEGDDEDCREYMTRVRDFLLQSISLLQTDYACRLAFSLARQVYVPPPIPAPD